MIAAELALALPVTGIDTRLYLVVATLFIALGALVLVVVGRRR